MDDALILSLNQFAQRSPVLDTVSRYFAANHLLKGGVFMTLFWWAWFTPDPDPARRRTRLITVMLGAFLAMALTRLLVMALPFRPRPMHDDGLDFVLPYGLDGSVFDNMSAFPSDHAALFAALSAGLVFVSRPLGLAMLAYTLLGICLPRIYLGYHWPSDIVAGLLLGATVAWATQRYASDSRFAGQLSATFERLPGMAYAGQFLVTFQVADMFDSSRALGRAGLALVNRLAGGG